LVPHLEVAIFGDKGEGQGGGGTKAGGMAGWQIAVAMAAAWTGGSALIAFGLGGVGTPSVFRGRRKGDDHEFGLANLLIAAGASFLIAAVVLQIFD
jgi:hypothetical protein